MGNVAEKSEEFVDENSNCEKDYRATAECKLLRAIESTEPETATVTSSHTTEQNASSSDHSPGGATEDVINDKTDCSRFSQDFEAPLTFNLTTTSGLVQPKQNPSTCSSLSSILYRPSANMAGVPSGELLARLIETGGIQAAQLSPAFLEANATSHIWVFSAIAELVDNAYDPEAKSTRMWITRQDIAGHTCLVFTDNGNGMNVDKLYKMLSFGFSEKKDAYNHKTVGRYGNGFKSGSMRLGKDAIVFTKCQDSKSVGMLSQTYLEGSASDTVKVPIVTWDSKDWKEPPVSEALGAITQQGLFNSSRQLLEQFQSFSDYPTGTRVIIYNLKKDTRGRLELDFESDPTDVLYSEHVVTEGADPLKPRAVMEKQPLFRRSLKEYLSILFLEPRMHIYLREKRIRTKKLKTELGSVVEVGYRSQLLNRTIPITFGRVKPNEDCGIMMYHNNRLIKGFEKVGVQRKKNNPDGLDVVGVVEVNDMTPIHNKQDFERNNIYTTLMSKIEEKLKHYLKKDGQGEQSQEIVQNTWTWVQCDRCGKWRRLQVVAKNLPLKWFCHMSRDPSHNRCEDEEEMLATAEEEKTAAKKRPLKRKATGGEKKQQGLKTPSRPPTPKNPRKETNTDSSMSAKHDNNSSTAQQQKKGLPASLGISPSAAVAAVQPTTRPPAPHIPFSSFDVDTKVKTEAGPMKKEPVEEFSADHLLPKDQDRPHTAEEHRRLKEELETIKEDNRQKADELSYVIYDKKLLEEQLAEEETTNRRRAAELNSLKEQHAKLEKILSEALGIVSKFPR